MNVITRPHRTPQVTDHERAVQCLCLQDSKKDDEVAVPVPAQEHEHYYPAPPHPTPRVTDHERAVLCLCLQDSKKDNEVAVPDPMSHVPALCPQVFPWRYDSLVL